MKNSGEFLGSATIGKKGQVVIPIETRTKMAWKEGDKLLVLGFKKGVVVLTKLDRIKQVASRLEKKMNEVKKYIKKTV